jgi:glutamate racemase
MEAARQLGIAPNPGDFPAGLPPGRVRCFATDSVEKFERLGSRFLGLPVGPVSLVDLGG